MQGVLHGADSHFGSRGYFSFLASPNLLAASFSSPLQLDLWGPGDLRLLVTPRPVRAAIMLFENYKLRTDHTLQAPRNDC